MVGATQQQTRADRARLHRFADIGCLACHIDRIGYALPTAHHAVEAGRRMTDEEGSEHQMTVPLCAWHHLGLVPAEYGGKVERARAYIGPSLEHHKQDFEAHYGTQRQLVQITTAMVRIIDSAARRGEYLPPSEVETTVCQLHREIVRGDPPSSGWRVNGT